MIPVFVVLLAVLLDLGYGRADGMPRFLQPMVVDI